MFLQLENSPSFNEMMSTYGLAVAIVLLILAMATFWFMKHWMKVLDQKRRRQSAIDDLELRRLEADINQKEVLTGTLVELRKDQKDMVAVGIKTYRATKENGGRIGEVEQKIENCVNRLEHVEKIVDPPGIG